MLNRLREAAKRAIVIAHDPKVKDPESVITHLLVFEVAHALSEGAHISYADCKTEELPTLEVNNKELVEKFRLCNSILNAAENALLRKANHLLEEFSKTLHSEDEEEEDDDDSMRDTKP